MLQADFGVLFQPEIQKIAEVKAGPGDAAKVVAKVRASPDPDIFWAKKNKEGKIEKIDVKADKKWDR